MSAPKPRRYPMTSAAALITLLTVAVGLTAALTPLGDALVSYFAVSGRTAVAVWGLIAFAAGSATGMVYFVEWAEGFWHAAPS